MEALADVLLNENVLLIFFFGASLFLMLVSGNPLIAWLKGLKGMKWSPREDTPDSHLQKAGVPSMGGIGIIGSALLSFIALLIFYAVLTKLAYSPPTGPSFSDYLPILLLPVVVCGHALLGLIDDWSKARGKGGILARQKLVGQVVLALGFLFFSARYVENMPPMVEPAELSSWPVWIGFLLIIIGTSNAVNLTDGIDGLAAGLSVQCALVFAFLLHNNEDPTSGVAFWLCLGGACLGFLAFNKNPAKVFMGDTGSLALGAAVGAGAILTRSVFLLPFIGFIFFVEMFSVIFQVAYFKYTKKRFGEGRRIFRRAPLHHHFELGGWREWRVVGNFWVVNAIATVIGLLLWKEGVIPRFP